MCGEGFDALIHEMSGTTWSCAGPIAPNIVDGGAPVPKVWFANVEASGFIADKYATVVREFVERAVDGHATRHVLAVNVVGSGRGGAAHDKGTLIESLVSALLDIVQSTREPGCIVDIVLVTHGRAAFSAAQRARQRIVAGAVHASGLSTFSASVLAGLDVPDPTAVEQALAQLVLAARSGRLVPFIGAGIGFGAGLPGWTGLLNELGERARQAHHAEGDGLGPELDTTSEAFQRMDARDQAEVLETWWDRSQLRRALVDILGVHRHSLCHALLSSTDPSHVVTTNYDRLMEEAFPLERRPSVLPREVVSDDGRWVLKLHGDIADPDGIVLTRGDYLGLQGGSQALLGIMQAMLMTQHMMFVGYSLEDDTFHRVMYDVRKALPRGKSHKSATVLLVSGSGFAHELWSDTLNVVVLHPSDTAIGGRNLEILLDLLAFEHADVSAFLLDETYSSLLTSEERRLRDGVRRVTNDAMNAGPVGERVRMMLNSLLHHEVS